MGNSERRSKYGDTDEVTAKKVQKCQEKGFMRVLCIGESLQERETGKTDAVNKRQLVACLPVVKDTISGLGRVPSGRPCSSPMQSSRLQIESS